LDATPVHVSVRLMLIEIDNLMETEAFALHLSRMLQAGDVVGFSGDLGAGKTTLIRALVSQLTDQPIRVNSPTYTLLNIYDVEPKIFHMDWYRCDEDSIFDLGLDEYLLQRQGPGISLVEWPQSLENIVNDFFSISLELKKPEHVSPDEADLSEVELAAAQHFVLSEQRLLKIEGIGSCANRLQRWFDEFYKGKT
jgi:tRNA threonylcarbamoyladenosine biosynthesis protein TsaE